MSKEYDQYLQDHIANVRHAYSWLVSHFKDLESKIGDQFIIFSAHDKSKYGDDEYKPYDDYFYGKNKSFKVVQKFKYAWLHHIHNNPHHWQYWVLINDDEPEEALEMPWWYAIEMICDWWAFSWKDGNLYKIFDWYDEHKDKMKLHPNTRRFIEDILKRMKEELDKEQTDHLEHHGIQGQKWGVQNGPPYPLNSQKQASIIFENAKKHITKIEKDVDDAAKASGSELYGLENKLKTKESIERKINKNEHEKDISTYDASSDIKDAIRFTTISSEKDYVNNYNSFKKSLEEKGYKEIRCKNYFDLFNKGKVKHKSVQSTFAADDGYEFEVQFHTDASQNAKNKKLPLYNERRQEGISEERARELEKQMEELALAVKDPISVELIKSHERN